jgi:hypothetical protein
VIESKRLAGRENGMEVATVEMDAEPLAAGGYEMDAK